MDTSKTFYTSLLIEALKNMSQDCSMVIGPIFSGDKESNLRTFNETISDLRKRGVVVFSQLDYLDDYVEGAPHDYKVKFPIFYKGLLYSGKVKEVYVLQGWEGSVGTKKEIEYAKERNLKIIYL